MVTKPSYAILQLTRYCLHVNGLHTATGNVLNCISLGDYVYTERT